MLVLLFVLGLSAGVATFVENDYGTSTARVAVYEAWWFELLLVLLCLNMVAVMVKTRMVRHVPRFLFHGAFVLILLGAALTRYLGVEGVLNLPHGQSVHGFLSAQNTIALTLNKEGNTQAYTFDYTANAWNNDFGKSVDFEGQNVRLHVKRVEIEKEGLATKASLEMELFYKDITHRVHLEEHALRVAEPVLFTLGDIHAALSYGAAFVPLPFAVALEEFEIVYYPGGTSPATYASAVLIEGKSYPIGMNAPLRLKGYTFYQSSYDEHGSILWVNKDPGKWPTYAGYAVLFLGLIWNLLDPSSRVRTLMRKVRAHEATLGVLLLCAFSAPLQAQTYEEVYVQEHTTGSLALAQAFGELVVQTRGGRMKPMDTLNREILRKLTGKETYGDMNANQVVLGMLTHQRLWKRLPLILVKDPKIKEHIGLPKEASLATFEDFFRGSAYKLEVLAHQAHQTRPANRGTYEKELIRVDERLNVAVMSFYGALFRFFPDPEDVHAPWLSMDAMWAQKAHGMHRATQRFMDRVFARDYAGAMVPLEEMATYAKTYGEPYALSPARLHAELWLNRLGIFPRLIGWYVGLGGVCLVLAFMHLGARRPKRWLHHALFGTLAALFVVHTGGIVLRWYVSGFIPMSNTYESIVYIAWSCALAGLVLFRRSLFGLGAALMLAGIFMLVAHLGNIDPQITPLVPVLQSFWLSVHVSIITASYGFLGVGALLGAMSLVLLALAKPLHVKHKNVEYLTWVNEASLIIGLTLLVIGNFLGGIWANESWGRYWGWDPKETWTFVSIALYVLVVHWRFLPKLYSAFSFSLMSLLSFGSILMTYFGVNFYLAGLHSYATGDPVPIPTWVFGLLGTVAVLAAVAYKNQSYVKKEQHEQCV